MTRASPSPPALRLVHALVFLALAAPVLWGSAGEWRHLAHALCQPFHAGAPPSVLLLAGALCAGLGGLRLLGALARGRSAPAWASGLVLAALCLTWVERAGGSRAEEERSETRTNMALLEVGRRVHLAMVGQLQQQGEVPREREAWEAALAGATARGDRVRDRAFRPRAPRLLRLSAQDALPSEPLVPGQLLAWVSEDGVTFELRIVGFDDGGGAALLKDPAGGALVLKGLFNPELPPPAGARLSEPLLP